MPVHSSMTSSMVILKDVKLKQPLVLMSFLDNSAIGVMTLKYIIENLKMSQFAHVSSPYVPPVTVLLPESYGILSGSTAMLRANTAL